MSTNSLNITFKIPASFGSPLIGRTYQAGSLNGYRFSINGQEKDDEIYGEGNATSAEYWEYDCRLGRRWNVDPKPQIKMSDYACFGNNPIFFIDIKGNTFDPSNDSKAKADNLKQEAQDSKKASESKLAGLEKQLENATEKNNKNPSKKLDNQIKFLQTQINETKQDIFQYESTICEINEMEASPVVFRFETSNVNRTIYQDGKVVMFSMNRNDMISHEAKHGYQYLMGEISFNNVGDPEWLYDINDEMATYYRQHAFEKNLNQFQTDPNKIEFYSGYTQSVVRGLSNSYLNLSNENLTVHSTLNQVLLAHGTLFTSLNEFVDKMSPKKKADKLSLPIKDCGVPNYIQRIQK